jgi:hypothetical protein
VLHFLPQRLHLRGRAAGRYHFCFGKLAAVNNCLRTGMPNGDCRKSLPWWKCAMSLSIAALLPSRFLRIDVHIGLSEIEKGKLELLTAAIVHCACAMPTSPGSQQSNGMSLGRYPPSSSWLPGLAGDRIAYHNTSASVGRCALSKGSFVHATPPTAHGGREVF